RIDDRRFTSNAPFAEATHQLDAGDSLHAGLRGTRDDAAALRSGETTSSTEDNQWLTSALPRHGEPRHGYRRGATGLAHPARAPAYWERTRNPAATSSMMAGAASTFALNPEHTTQLDIGLVYSSTDIKASVSAFYAHHDDYILIEKLSAVASDARNIR